jgi:hypothetical protein
VGLHELGHDLVFASELGFELLDLGVLGGLGDLALAVLGEGEVAILEELALPDVKEVGRDLEFVAELGDGDILKEVTPKHGNFLLRGKVTPGTVVTHGKSSVHGDLTTNAGKSSSD